MPSGTKDERKSQLAESTNEARYRKGQSREAGGGGNGGGGEGGEGEEEKEEEDEMEMEVEEEGEVEKIVIESMLERR